MKKYEVRKILRPLNENDSVVSLHLLDEVEPGNNIRGYGVYVDASPLPNGIIPQQFTGYEYPDRDSAERTMADLNQSWLNTHFEITFYITEELLKTEPTKLIEDRYNRDGRCGMYDLAEELTDKFETINLNREWDGEFFDEIDEFCKTELNR